jgi:hypothetical protein
MKLAVGDGVFVGLSIRATTAYYNSHGGWLP